LAAVASLLSRFLLSSRHFVEDTPFMLVPTYNGPSVTGDSRVTEVQSDQEIEAKRLKWHSRRGMLELDVLLVPFAEKAWSRLGPEDQVAYKLLLDQEDTDLFAWFLERQEPQDPVLARAVRLVLEHARQGT
jgi:antitoxin CptB